MPPADDVVPFRVCFVCAGNICRSPMAEIVFRDLADRAGLSRWVTASSAGIGDWHVGERADRRTLEALAERGYDGSGHRARQFESEWFADLDLVVALDGGHAETLAAWAPDDEARERIALLMSFSPEHPHDADVPDPYYGDVRMFGHVLGMIETASTALFRQLEPAIRQGASR